MTLPPSSAPWSGAFGMKLGIGGIPGIRGIPGISPKPSPIWLGTRLLRVCWRDSLLLLVFEFPWSFGLLCSWLILILCFSPDSLLVVEATAKVANTRNVNKILAAILTPSNVNSLALFWKFLANLWARSIKNDYIQFQCALYPSECNYTMECFISPQHLYLRTDHQTPRSIMFCRVIAWIR